LDNISVEKLQHLVNNSGFTALEAEDIHEIVLKACRILSESPAYGEFLTRLFVSKTKIERYKEMFAFKGTPSYEKLKNGKINYWRWMLQKPR